ncbi:MAG: hypothetical protein KDC38_10465 [Planctomycetes bacterium]|nr:hypothetical protein [Planctomycetota bacterium]
MGIRIQRAGIGALLLLAPVIGRALADGPGVETTPEERARVHVERMWEEWRSADQRMRDELERVRASDEYVQAMKSGDRATATRMTSSIALPFQQAWRDRIAAAMTECGSPTARLHFVGLLLRTRIDRDPVGLLRSTIEEFASSEHLLPVARRFDRLSRAIPGEEYRALLDRVIDENPLPETRAFAYYCRGLSRIERGEPTDEARELAERDFERVVELVPEDSLLSIRARGPKFSRERLKVGLEAPDIVGTDLDGVPFRLSDYRGKVILLDFWGDW